MTTQAFIEAERQQHGLLAKIERHVLLWLARRIPGWVTPDYLTIMALTAFLVAGLSYYYSRANPPLLHVVNACLFVNWLGDSLDGTLARYRNQQRPRYGFYVDHMVDAIGTFFLVGGLTFSGHMSKEVGFGVLIIYYLLCINVFLATYTIGEFRISFASVSPTELRLILGIGNIALLYHPTTRLFGQSRPLFDVGGIVAIFLMLIMLIVSTIRNTKLLYQAERIS